MNVRLESDKTYKITARIGGISYLLLIFLGLYAELFVRERLLAGNGYEIINNVLNHEMLYRSAFLSDLIMVLLDIIVGIVFYIILKKTNWIIALTGLVLRLSQSILLAVNLIRMHTALQLFKASSHSTDYYAVLGLAELNIFKYGYFLALIFFGLYLVVIASQLYQRDYFNKIIVLFIGISGLFYIADSLVNFLLPDLTYITSSTPVMMLWIITEIAIALELIRLSFRKKSFE